MSPLALTIICTLFLFVLFTIGLPIGFSMALIGILGFAAVVNFHAACNMAAMDFYSGLANYGFTVIPLFMLMGQIAANAGVARRLYDTSYKFVGHISGGIGLATVLGALFFKAICGSTNATTATFAVVAIPEMDKFNYDKRLSCGLVATIGTLGCIIPPSIVLIIYGIISEQSIGRLFLAGIFPGLIISACYFIIILAWAKINPALAPKGERSTWKERIRATPSIAPVCIIFIIIMGGLTFGYFTPTEAGSVGTLAVILLTLIKKDVDIKGVIKSILGSLHYACMVLVLLAGAMVLGRFFAITRIPFFIADWIGSLPLSKELIMIVIMLVYLVGGSIIDDAAFVVLITPIFLPLVNKIGYDPIWFGIMVMVTLMIGIVIPPVAMCVFIVSSITKVPQGIVYRGVYPFLIGMVFVIVLLFLFPGITLWLPNLLMK